jgi:hypothetical protein
VIQQVWGKAMYMGRGLGEEDGVTF